MSHSLADLLPAADGPVAIRLWLKSSAYTRRLLLGESGDPWESASKYLSYFTQAHGLLKPDVAVIEVGELFEAWLQRNPAVRAELGGKRKLSYPLRKLLEMQQPRELLAEVVEAVLAHLRGQAPLVLAMPSPLHWLHLANAAAGREEVEFDADSIEDGAMYVADLLRAVSAHQVGGVLLEEDRRAGSQVSTDLELYRPIINVTKHYRWPMAIRLAQLESGAVPSDIEVFIATGNLAACGMARGLDVSAPLWNGDEVPGLDSRQFYFVEVAKDERPEHVLDCLARLRR